MSRIADNITALRRNLPPNITLLCVSKYHTVESIEEAYSAGERLFAESRLKELQSKYAVLPRDIKWHFIGHLQTNKIRQLLPLVSLIHGVDSIRLLETINREAQKQAVITEVLLEVHISQDDTKYGFSEQDIRSLFRQRVWENLSNVKIRGLMGMASLTDDKQQIRTEFHNIKTLFDDIKSQYYNTSDFDILSIGMTDDYPIAIEEGSTLIRIGTGIFGEKTADY